MISGMQRFDISFWMAASPLGCHSGYNSRLLLTRTLYFYAQFTWLAHDTNLNLPLFKSELIFVIDDTEKIK